MHDDVAVIIWRETSFRSTRPTLEQKRAGDELVVLVLTRPGFLGGKSAFWRETGRLITQTPNSLFDGGFGVRTDVDRTSVGRRLKQSQSPSLDSGP